MMSKEQFTILLIEDSPSDADLFQEMLLDVPASEFKVVIATRLREGLKHLAAAPVNLILLDLSLPDSQGLETFRQIQAAAVETPVIVLTGLDDETLALKAVSLGAQDYLIKDNVGSNLLARAIRYSIERKRLTNTLHQHEQEFKTLVENAPDVISRVDRDLRRIYVNPAIEKATGIPPSEYIGKTYQDLGVIGEAISLWDATIQVVFESGQERIIEYAAPAPNGWHYYQTRIVPEFAGDGSISTVLSIARDITDRKVMEIALQESDERYRALFERSLDAVYLYDFSGRFLDANPAALNLLGYDKEEMVKLDFQSLMRVNEVTVALQLFLEVQEKGTQSQVREFTLRTKKGQEIIVETMASLIFRDGKAYAIQGVARDVTVRKQAEAVLRQSEQTIRASEERFRALIQNSSDVISVFDANGVTIFQSPAIERVMGYVPEAIIGLSVFDVIHPDDLDLTRTCFDELIQGKVNSLSVEMRLLHLDGAWRTLEAVLTNQLDNPAINGIVVNSRDITERKRDEEIQSRLAAIVEFSDDAIISKTSDGTVMTWNEGATKLFGYTAEEVVGRSITVLFPPHLLEEEKEILKKLVRGESIQNYETIRVHKDSTQIHVSLSISPIRDKNDNMIGASKIVRDISERKRVEAALEESDRFGRATVDALSAHIAILDETGTIIAVNQAWKNFAADNAASGLSTTFEGVNYLRVCDEAIGPDVEVATVFAAGIRAVMHRDRKDFSLEYSCHSPSEQRWFVGRVTRFPGDGPVRVAIAHENITERKQIENELTALYDATSFLFKSDSLLNLGYQVVQAVITSFQHVHCALLLKEKISGEIIRFTRSGVYEVSADKPLSIDSQGLVPQTFRTGKNIYSPNVLTDALYLASDARTRSELVIPLKTASGTLAVLDLQSMNLDAFSPRDQRILTAFAERAAAAIETMQLYEEINRHAAELEWRVSKRTAELQRAKEQVEAILNQSSDAIMLVGLNTDIQQTNPAFSQLLGYPIDEAFGKNIRVLADAVDAQILVETIEKVILMHEPHRIEVVLQRIDGSTFDADVVLAPLTRYETDNVTVICSIRDNTARKRAEEDLHKALAIEKELNELKSRFVSMVSHDFRTPLATIQSSSDLLRHYSDRITAERKEEHFNSISGQIQHLTGLLEDVLTLGQAESVGFAFNAIPTDLALFCQTIAGEMQMLAGTRQIKFAANQKSGLIEIDTKLLRRVIVNLLSNAVKYSPEGSVIEFSLFCGKEQAVISIKDQGIGIPEADLNHLFEVFHRAGNVGSIPGTGLGLAIVKQSVEAHGGSIRVDSHADLGTTFTISLPLNPVKDAVA